MQVTRIASRKEAVEKNIRTGRKRHFLYAEITIYNE
jgi:phosphopantetheinyl transferase (holo-ACP synthase)